METKISSNNLVQLNSENFESFIQALKEGEEHAWNILHFVLKRIVKYSFVEKVNNPQNLEHLFNETFLTFYKLFKKCKFENFKNLKAYILSIAEKKLKESFRKQKVEKRFVDIDDFYPKHLYQQNESVEHQLEIRNLVELLLSCLSNLERKILYNYFNQGVKLKEIAVNLGITDENCRLLKHRALQKLKIKFVELDK